MTFSGKTPFIIGICGGSGAGKTTLLRRLSDIFGEVKPSIFSMDNYYFPKSMQQLDSNGIVNLDLPTAIDEERLTADLKSLIKKLSVEINTDKKKAHKTILFSPSAASFDYFKNFEIFINRNYKKVCRTKIISNGKLF